MTTEEARKALLSNIDAAPALLWNESASENSHLRIRLIGSGSNRLALGAQVKVRSGELRQLREVRSGGSYLSQDELVLHFGLGSRTKADSVEVRWPTGEVSVLRDVDAGGEITIRQGPTGQTAIR